MPNTGIFVVFCFFSGLAALRLRTIQAALISFMSRWLNSRHEGLRRHSRFNHAFSEGLEGEGLAGAVLLCTAPSPHLAPGHPPLPFPPFRGCSIIIIIIITQQRSSTTVSQHHGGSIGHGEVWSQRARRREERALPFRDPKTIEGLELGIARDLHSV